MSKTKARKPIEIKIATVVAVSAILHETDPAVIDAALREITCGESDYFDDELAILDVSPIDPANRGIDWPALIALFKSYRLNPIAVRNAAADMHHEILAHGLSLDTVAQPRQANAPEPVMAVAIEPVAPVMPAPSAKPGAMLVDMPVRAGQRIYAQGRDLIVTAVVNNGAEIIADGSIHIYAPLRGRALAGASGDANARIFTMSMEAELVSIAGMYRTFESGLPKDLARLPVQIRLTGDRIDVLTMKF
ncbi:MAG: septum site-determining protein MinC [Burkholderiales bacterium RIFCSPLOWO2_02_FULL_57_36]|nr:MAG: septum site-determining protein MinC [Burkholderiales bacterium RIFCSPLOWO2_02_FULL_57_36]